MRPTKSPCSKTLWATIEFEWRCEASDRRPFTLSLRRPCWRRCWLSRQIVACLTVLRFVAAGLASAPWQVPAEAGAAAASIIALAAARGAIARRARTERRRGCFRAWVMGVRASFREGRTAGLHSVIGSALEPFRAPYRTRTCVYLMWRDMQTR